MTEAYLLVINAATVAAFAFVFVNCLWRHSKTRKITNFWLAVAIGIFFLTISALANLLLELEITSYFVNECCRLFIVACAVFLLIAAWLYKKNRAGKSHARHIR